MAQINAKGRSATELASPAATNMQPPPVKKQESVLQRLVSASFGAAATVLFTSPMDVVKVRQQSASSNIRLVASQLEEQLNAERMENPLIRCPACGVVGHKSVASSEAAGCLHPNHNHHQHHTHAPSSATAAAATTNTSTAKAVPPQRVKVSAFSTMSNVVKTEGVWALWSGLKPGLVMALPSTTLYFALYEELREYLDTHWRAHKLKQGVAANADAGVSAVAPMAAGIISRVFTVAVVSPLELIRTKEMYKRTGRPLVTALMDEVRHSGSILSLWRGFGATVWRDVPFSGVYWFTYENAKSFLTKHRVRALVREQEHKAAAAGLSASPAAPQLGFLDTFGVSFGSGVAAGGLSALITTPWDVIKTRTQVAGMPGQPAATAAHPHGQLPSGTAAALLHIARHEGPTGLFAGVSARVAKVAPACAIMIGSYELGKMVFAKCFPTTSAPASADGSSPSTLASMALEASASAHDASKGVNNDEAQA